MKLREMTAVLLTTSENLSTVTDIPVFKTVWVSASLSFGLHLYIDFSFGLH